MRFVTYQHGHKTSAGLIRGQFVYDLAQAYFRAFRRPFKWTDLRAFLESGTHEKIAEVDFNLMRDDRLVAIPLREARFRAPILRPPKIVCVGLNYRDHATEQKIDPPSAPLLFAKAPTSVIADGDDVHIPFKIARADASRHVFGYTVLNDVTARDIQQSDKQWFRAKSFATFAPMGPVVVTPDEFDPRAAAIDLTVNGETRQNGSTADMVFDVAALIEYMSDCFPLEVGDVISTGTPSGVGVFRNPPVFLKSGDRMEATIRGIGTLTNTVK
jgi:2-keto-4-pentenoate hydratase/2-oxohepta-3-ene-1,7-dioic acid hydratase in catechol pathway